VQIISRVVDGIAKYECNHGYSLEGAAVRKCLHGGIWDGKAPICKRKLEKCLLYQTNKLGCFFLAAILCSALDSPLYGSVKIISDKVNGTALYKCNYGYFLDGVELRRCLYNGVWDGIAPTCKRKQLEENSREVNDADFSLP